MPHSTRAQSAASHDRLATLYRLSVSLQEAGDEVAILRALADGLRALRLAAYVGRLETDGQAVRLLAAHGARRRERRPGSGGSDPGWERLPLTEGSWVSRVVRGRETLFLPDIPDDLAALLAKLEPDEPSALARVRARAVCTPMVVRGRTDGLLLVTGEVLNERDAAMLRTLGEHLAVALENATLLNDLKQALLREHAVARELRRLESLVAELSAEREPESVLRRVVLSASDALSAERVALFLVNQEQTALILATSVGLTRELGAALERLPLDHHGGPLARAALERAPVVVADTREAAEWTPLRAAREVGGIGAVWAVPLVSRQGDALGVLAILADRPGAPPPELVALAERYAHHAALAIMGSRFFERQTHQARAAALAELARSIPHELGQPLAIISGYAELIAAGLLDGERLREACHELVAAANEMARFVQQLERVTNYATKEFGPGRTVIDFERAVEND